MSAEDGVLWMGWLAIAAGLWPIVRCVRLNWTTSLRDATVWAVLAWLSWGLAFTWLPSVDLAYLALCFTGCAGVAVFGARRPHVFAWNFVVLGLLGVMTLPLLEGMVIRVHSFNIERKIFLAAILFVTIANYFPTRFALAALVLFFGCLLTYRKIILPIPFLPVDEDLLIMGAIGLAPWFAWYAVPLHANDPFDRAWGEFRDRYGFVWGSRVREQFNAAAKNAELPLHLEWRGRSPKHGINDEVLREAYAILQKVTKRFLGGTP